MTTPEQLLADSGWRRQHSIYTLWTVLCGLGFVSLFYTGARAKKRHWMIWGAIYGVIVMVTVSVGGELSPEDPEAPTPAIASVMYTTFMIIWIVSAVHVFMTRKEWLRWKAAAAGRPQWYETTVPATSPQSTGGLTGIGIADPTAEYLAPAPKPSSAPPPPPPPPATAPERRLPPPPTTPPARTTDRNTPPPPRVPAPVVAGPERTSSPVDLNTATVDEIASLPGVGVAIAHRIVEERSRRGGFSSVDDAAAAAKLQPHLRSRLQQAAVVSDRNPPAHRRTAGRIVDI